MSRLRIAIQVVVLALIALTAAAQTAKRQLTIDDIFDRTKHIAAAGSTQRRYTWADDTHFFWPRSATTGEITGFALVDATTGEETALFDAQELEAQVSKIDGVSSDEAKRIARPRSVQIDWGTRGVLLSIKGDLYIYNIRSKALTRLTSAAGDEEQATFSPDGKLVAFVRDNNLYTIDVATRSEHQLTTDGARKIFNGVLDWVYEEEVYGRGLPKAYWWSPDSKSIAYLKLDDTKVPDFTVVDHIPPHQKLEVTPYPKAGDPNPVATLYVADLATGASTRADRLGDPASMLIVDVSWRPDSSMVVFEVQDREQTWLDVNEVPRGGGDTRRLLHETTKAWVNVEGSPFFLKDGSFLWLSESTGYKHIYRVSGDKRTAITTGDWEVRKLFGVDEKSGWIYYTSIERSPIGEDVWRVRLDGSRKERLTEKAGTHAANFNPSLTRFVDVLSDINTPPQIAVAEANGKTAKVIDGGTGRDLDQFELGTPEFVTVKTRDGFAMNAMIIRPPHFDASKKYPVFEHTYSGPHAPQVKNGWGGSNYLWMQMLAERGIVVWVCDNRTASGMGAISTWPVYKNFGPLELRDLEDGLTWLESNPWIDSSRVMLDGWSFGGFMTSFALTHSTMWSAGISGGTVADWHDYDSIYTERYMLTPEHNPEGYAQGPRQAAKNLHGNILLVHGTIDDNVHMQNTIQFVYELEKAGKQFDLMVYPKSRHGVIDPDLTKQMHQMMFDFVMRNLRP